MQRDRFKSFNQCAGKHTGPGDTVVGRERIVENHRFSKVQVRAGQSESESDRMRRKQKNLIFARVISR